MVRGKRGGQRTPRNPAAVSGVGAKSQRTDGRPEMPPVAANGQPYGERQATEGIASAAPMYDEQQPGPTPTGVTPGALPDMFGPTQRATPPMVGDQLTQAPPADQILRAIYDAYPSPWIASLLGDDY